MSIQEQAVQMINDLSEDNVVFLVDFMKRFMLPKKSDETLTFKPEILEAMDEAKRISKNPDTKKYASFAEVLEDLDL